MAGFDDAIDSSEYERDFPRENLHAKAEIRVDGQWRDCVVINISASGAKMYVGMEVKRGADVLIRFEEIGEFDATVAWCHADEIGVRFSHNPEEMNRVIIALESR